MDNHNFQKNDKHAQAQQDLVQLLSGSSYIESIEELRERSASFEDIESLILKLAPSVMSTGNFPLLQNLINILPDEHHSPWILYWSATAS